MNETLAQKLLRLARLRHYEKHIALLERSSMLLAKQRYMAFKRVSKTIAERLVRPSTKRSHEKGKRMSESVSERFERQSKKRKSQQQSWDLKITKYDMEAVSHQITDNNQVMEELRNFHSIG